jgi:sugar transferase (PEP-CTERM/EpsH1 system associated)
MEDLVFLAHRIPYPPDKGDKIRALNVLRHLTARYRVHLATFVDAPGDAEHVQKLQEICASVFWRRLNPKTARLRSLRGLLTGASLTEGYFHDHIFREEVDRIVDRHRPTILYVFSSAMAPYALHHRGLRLILDLVDVDSEKWGQYAKTGPFALRPLYQREQRMLRGLERKAAIRADVVTLVTSAEAQLFSNLAPESTNKTHFVGNGVDLNFFNPNLELVNPLGTGDGIVFTGAMDYRPNVEAMRWFAREVMPLLRKHRHSPRLWVVGTNPVRSVRALAASDVCVTGRVPDVRPYLRHARVVVAPMHIARGIQNKVIEAMAMGRPVVVTPQVSRSLPLDAAKIVLTARSPEEYAEVIMRVARGGFSGLGAQAREYALKHFRWEHILENLDQLLDANRSAMVAGAAPPQWSCG